MKGNINNVKPVEKISQVYPEKKKPQTLPKRSTKTSSTTSTFKEILEKCLNQWVACNILIN